MRNIPGNRFINRTRSNTKWFKKDVPYVLKNIKPEENSIKYIFTFGYKEEKDIVFENAKQADNFLDQFKI
tara:strand:+ start:301 stop:510 length:210 start_codon:yes stop_codon:yes gene_type:complete